MNKEEEEITNEICRTIIRWTEGKPCNDQIKNAVNFMVHEVGSEASLYYTKIHGWYEKDNNCVPIYFNTYDNNYFIMNKYRTKGKDMFNRQIINLACFEKTMKVWTEDKDSPFNQIRKDKLQGKLTCHDDAERLYYDDDEKDKYEILGIAVDTNPLKEGKMMAGLTFSRHKSEMDVYIASRMSLLLEANKDINKDNETMQLCIEGVWKQLEHEFEEWCKELIE